MDEMDDHFLYCNYAQVLCVSTEISFPCCNIFVSLTVVVAIYTLGFHASQQLLSVNPTMENIDPCSKEQSIHRDISFEWQKKKTPTFDKTFPNHTAVNWMHL